MNTFTRVTAMLVGVAAMYAGAAPSLAQSTDAAKTTQDLTSVIALQGLACGKVVAAEQQGPDDYAATCSDGNRYRVYVNADGRVVVEKLN